ncbi:AraC family transcriptional regulator [Paenibacillus qinlingensis]|uniref:AraC family transcriptional regulator n=1 Tax=Paenibacillus qinlingensis TaxID=1837343 RepID=UPI0015634DE1|nr:AraC family transcriptional regulator [Paenibacillus qinlingensis]NQX61066.1 AraC family transcriptional regulator [Paenibacillus qinlingensis]
MKKTKALVYEGPSEKPDFPVRISYNDSRNVMHDSDRLVYCHYHDEFEFNYVIEGSIVMEIDTNLIRVCAGDAVIINRKEIHSGYCENGEHCRMFGIIFKLDMLCSHEPDACQSKYLDPFLCGQYKFPSYIPNVPGWQSKVISEIVRIVESLQQQPFGYEWKIKSSLFSIMAEIIANKAFLTHNGQKCLLNEKLDRFQKTIAYIQERYNSHITIEDLAGVAGISVDHFYKFFKQISGESPVTYVNRHRIRMASNLLKYTDLSVLDIALQIGFDNVSYFIKTFKKYTGFTPRVWRKKNGMVAYN